MRNGKLVRNHLFLDDIHYTFTSASILYSALKSIKIKTNFHLLYYSNRFCRRPRGSWLDATLHCYSSSYIPHIYRDLARGKLIIIIWKATVEKKIKTFRFSIASHVVSSTWTNRIPGILFRIRHAYALLGVLGYTSISLTFLVQLILLIRDIVWQLNVISITRRCRVWNQIWKRCLEINVKSILLANIWNPNGLLFGFRLEIKKILSSEDITVE